MSTLAGLLGSGIGFIVAGAAWVAMRYYPRLPGNLHPWIRRGLIAVMFIAGSALAVTTLGTWIRGAIVTVAGWLGGMNSGTAHAVITVAALALLAEVVFGFVFDPADGIAMTALVVPLVLSLPAGGVLHQVFTGTTVPAQSAAAAFSAWLGG